MVRSISPEFLHELLHGSLFPLLKYVREDDTLNMELRGNRVTVYYRGGALLTVMEESYLFSGMDTEYWLGAPPFLPSVSTIGEYFPQAKHIIDVYTSVKRNHLGEKDIQQMIARENNYSPISTDTDYFVIDTEYQDLGRFDIVALRWDSTSQARKLPKSYLPVLTVFEVKMGCGSVGGKKGLYDHFKDYEEFCRTKDVTAFKKDMIEVFRQKRELGLIHGMEKYREVTEVADEIEFVFLLANYKRASKQMQNELERIKQACFGCKPKFICANFMGYGLYSHNIITEEEFESYLLWK
ncbi:MAG: hypothetical protein LUG98_04725 [Tannerellaceae bacterium]|nr:hypothetical protein [Tannerellaceae bacterium]